VLHHYVKFACATTRVRFLLQYTATATTNVAQRSGSAVVALINRHGVLIIAPFLMYQHTPTGFQKLV
jgi:hypothetical protein